MYIFSNYLINNNIKKYNLCYILYISKGSFYNQNGSYDKGYKFLHYLEKKFNGPLVMKANFYKQLAISLEHLKKVINL